MNKYKISIFIVLFALIVPYVSADAFSAWQSTNGCWTATNDTYTLVMWNSTGVKSWNVPSGVTSVDYLVVAGGGGGGSGYYGGGGGGGGVGSGTMSSLTPGGTVTVTVGGAGTAGTYDGGTFTKGGTGGSSVFNTVTIAGGGGGGSYSAGTKSGDNGANGGGGSGFSGGSLGGTGAIGGDGGAGGNGGDASGGGGGGMANGDGGAGSAVASSNGGAGGAGIASSIDGTERYYGAGGGGGARDGGTGGAGGSSVGGVGGKPTTYTAPTSGTANRGSGGGGGSYNPSAAGGAAGTAGVVIIQYQTPSGGSAPVANFTKNVSVGTAPLSVSFTDTSTNTPTSWNWSYANVTGNNTEIWFSQSQNPSFTFPVGNWSIRLNATNSYGTNTTPYNSSFVNVSAVVVTPPVASFTKNVSSGTAPLAVAFTDTSTNTPTSWNYSYTNVTGNGTEVWFSQSQNPSFTFPVGNWSVRLNATNAGGSNTTPYNSSFVNVSAFMPYPILSFTSNTTSGYSPLAVQFNDTSVTSITGWNWTFGAANYSSLQNPVYTFVGSGQYSVTLTVTNASRSNTSVFTNYITVTSAPIPIANFASNATTGYPGTVVSFTDTSTNTPTSWNWSFGDGSYSEVQNPIHNYTSVGSYDVALNATNAYGSNTNTKNAYIVISAIPAPVANFAANITSGIPPNLPVQFTDMSTNTPTSWNWSFGEGNYSTSQNPVNVYHNVGTYNVSLTATNAGGNNTMTKTNYITVANSSGFNQQDLTMAPQYTITVTITDSTTNNVIPVVIVIDNNGNNVTTSNGTFVGTYPYSVIALTYFASGYTAKQVSYIMNRDQAQTVQLTPTTTTTNANTVWYVPKTVEFHTIDNYGNYLVGANVTARFNSSSNLPGGVSNLLTFYGMNQQAANDAANGTLIMTGISDSMGNNVFTMLSTLNYDVYVTYGGVTNYFTIHPQSTNYELRFLGAVVPDYSTQTCLYANGHTYTSASSDYLGNFTMGFSYQDTCSKTTAIDYYVILQNTNTEVYHYTQTPVTSGIYTLNYTVPNVRGNNYAWFENYTRSV